MWYATARNDLAVASPIFRKGNSIDATPSMFALCFVTSVQLARASSLAYVGGESAHSVLYEALTNLGCWQRP